MNNLNMFPLFGSRFSWGRSGL